MEAYASTTPVHYANLNNVPTDAALKDFTYAAAVSTPTVVHIKSKVRAHQASYKSYGYGFWDLFGPPPSQGQLKEASGSGVIISNDGYIVTNNHVIKDAEEIEVTLHDKRSYTAELIGVDPSTDLALIRIEDNGLPHIAFANSDEIQVGEWVVAVGNPFNLASTVTAGIVSAKARNINILKDKSSIESFIQTDAAVNPGNSGGALVNLTGELIGINTAIATPTGAYAGYSFAVPVNIVKKVVNDLREFGKVKRGYMGVYIRDIDNELADQLGLKNMQGIYIEGLVEGGAAKKSGIKEGDVVVEIGGMKTSSSPQLQEIIARHRPGEKVDVKVIRNGNIKTIPVTLEGELSPGSLSAKMVKPLGAELQALSERESQQLNVQSGVKVNKLYDGKLKNETDIQENFIILRIDNHPVRSVEQVEEILKNKKGGVLIEGKYPNRSGLYYYGFGL